MPLLFNGGRIAAGTEIPLTNETGSDRGNVTATYDGQTFTVALPTKTDTVVDQQPYDILSSDGNTTLVSALAYIPISVFHGLTLQDAYAVVQDNDPVSLYDSAGNALPDGTGNVTGNALTVEVPDSIIGGSGGPSQGDDVGVWNAANSSRMFIGTADFSTGPLKVLAPGTVADLHDSGEVTLQNNAGDARGTLNVSVGGNIGVLSLKAKEDKVTDQQSLKIFYSNGDDTGETVAVNVPAAVAEGVQITQAYTIVTALQWLTIVNSDSSKSVQGLSSLTDTGRFDNASLDSSVAITENSDQVTCTLDGVQKVLTISVTDGKISAVTSADPPAP